jgi:hypothetical protein
MRRENILPFTRNLQKNPRTIHSQPNAETPYGALTKPEKSERGASSELALDNLIF